MPSDPLQNLIDLMRASPMTRDTPIERLRAGIDLLGSMAPVPEHVEVSELDVAGRPAVWLTPDDAIDDRTLLYLHGGGYNIGGLTSHTTAAAHLAAACRARALLIDYRLAPEHPYPAALDDALSAYRWLIDPDGGGADPASLIVVGESAGGGLTLATLLAARDAGLPLPAAAVPLSPWADLTCEAESMRVNAGHDPILVPDALRWWAANYAAGRLTEPLVSPVFADLGGLPPLLILVAETEVLRDDATTVGAAVEASGGEVTVEIWADTVHAWTLFAGAVPESDEAVARIARFVDEVLASSTRC